MKYLLKTLIAAVVLGAAAASMGGCLPYKTGSTEVGVRTVKWSPFGGKGVQDTLYEPGRTHFFFPLTTDWHTFDTSLQVLEMTESVQTGDRRARDELLFKTIDGNDIGLEVIVSYKVIPEMAPYILQEVARSDEELRENIMRTIARSKPRDIFGELDSEEFYIAENRSKKAEAVRVRLNEMLEEYGVVVEKVDTKDYRFNPEYAAAIEQKKIADQEAERLQSETDAKEEEFKTAVQEELAEVAKVKERADGEYRRKQIEADAYHAQQDLLAKAIEAEGKAEAEAIEAMNKALAGAGGEAMVKLEIAGALQGKRIIMLPVGGGGLDLRTTNVNDLLQLYGIKSLAGEGQRPAPAQQQQQ